MDDMFVVKKALDALEQAEQALFEGNPDLATTWMVMSDKWLHIYEHVGLPEDDDEAETVGDDEEDFDEDDDDDVDLAAANLNGSYDAGALELVDDDPDDVARLGP